MSFFQSVGALLMQSVGIQPPEEQRNGSFQEVWGMGGPWGGTPTKSGKRVNTESALAVSAVYGSVRILSDSISTLPLGAYKAAGESRIRLEPYPEWLGFDRGPYGRIDVLSQIMVSLLTDGNAYIVTYRDRTGMVVWTEVIDPQAVSVERDGAALKYRINGSEQLTAMDVLHIPGMMLPGAITGMSPIQYARESIGLSIASTEYGAAFFGNGAIPKTVVETSSAMSEDGINRLKAAWQDTHGGSGNSNKLAVLTEGAKFSTVSIAPDDSQFVETRAFQVADIARIYGVPPHLLADSTGSTSWGSGLAAQNATFLQHSLRPWIERIEYGLTRTLISEGRGRDAFVKLNVDGLLRGDNKDRMDSYDKGLRSGLYTINEVRALEEMPPVDWGDKPFIVGSGRSQAPTNQAPEEGEA